MGLSGIAKAPVSHGVEPHDLETGGLALASALAFRLYRSSLSPPLPRERFSARVEPSHLEFGHWKTAVGSQAEVPSDVPAKYKYSRLSQSRLLPPPFAHVAPMI